MQLHSCARTHCGHLRRINEDCLHNDPHNGLFMIADGLGGHAAGEVASRLAIERVLEVLGDATFKTAAADLRAAVAAANCAVREAAAANPHQRGMGTTLTILQLELDAERIHLAHVGDSRAYRCRNDRLEQLSDDQTLLGEQQRSGQIRPVAAADGSLGHILLQAVGLEEQLDIQTAAWPVQSGDLYLLCSDGLSDMLGDQRIAEILVAPQSLSERAQQLEKQALGAGGRDNISLILIELSADS